MLNECRTVLPFVYSHRAAAHQLILRCCKFSSEFSRVQTHPYGHSGKKSCQHPVSMRSLGCTATRKFDRLDSSRSKNHNQFPERPAGALEIANFQDFQTGFWKLKTQCKIVTVPFERSDAPLARLGPLGPPPSPRSMRCCEASV